MIRFTRMVMLVVIAVLALSFAAPAEACGGRGIPGLRRLRGRGIGQANYAGSYFRGGKGGCAA